MKYLLLLLPIMGMSQVEGLRDIPVAVYRFQPNALRAPADTMPFPRQLNAPGEIGVDGSALGLSFPMAACTERERAIQKMMVDIDCFGLTASELGFECNSSRCEGGVDDGFVVKQDAIKTGFADCPYLVSVYPVEPRLPIGRLWRGNQGNEPMDWIFICKSCFYARGDTLILD